MIDADSWMIAMSGGETEMTIKEKIEALKAYFASKGIPSIFDTKTTTKRSSFDPFSSDMGLFSIPGSLDTSCSYEDDFIYNTGDFSGYLYKKTDFGAYTLFLLSKSEWEYEEKNRFEPSGIVEERQLLPRTRELIEKLSTSISVCPSLPRDVEKELAKVDWTRRNVMVGAVRTREQLWFNLEKKGYYVPAKFLSEDRLPIQYIAFHEEAPGGGWCIQRFGEVLTVQKIKRGRIPVTMRPGGNPEELYYYFTVRKWVMLPRRIAIENGARGKPGFTNYFLLTHCTKSFQLYAISSEEDYRLMMRMNQMFEALTDSQQKKMLFPLNDSCSVTVFRDLFIIKNHQGKILGQLPINHFLYSPSSVFNRIKKILSQA